MRVSYTSTYIVLFTAIACNWIPVDGYVLPADVDELEIVDQIDADGDNNEINIENLQRSKRSPQDYDSAVVFSPDYGYGYYVFPRSSTAYQQRSANYEYNPLIRYKSTRTKKKKLFVPNLFG